MNLHFSRKKGFKDLKLTLRNLKNTNSIVEILLAITIDIATYMTHNFDGYIYLSGAIYLSGTYIYLVDIFIWCRFIEINKKYGRVTLVKLYFFILVHLQCDMVHMFPMSMTFVTSFFNEKAGFFINSD